MASLFRSLNFNALAAASLALAVLPGLPVAQANVLVSGESDAIRIEANDASLEEVFTALNASYGIQYRLPENLDRSISGTYTGPLAQVLFRLLQGCNFAVETSASGTSIRIYDLSNGHATTGVSVASHGFPGSPAIASPLPPRLPATPLVQPVPSHRGLPLARGIESRVRARAQRAGQ